jgi:hypothetical protein
MTEDSKKPIVVGVVSKVRSRPPRLPFPSRGAGAQEVFDRIPDDAICHPFVNVRLRTHLLSKRILLSKEAATGNRHEE